MSGRIEEILEVLRQVQSRYTPGMSFQKVRQLRIEAIHKVAGDGSI